MKKFTKLVFISATFFNSDQQGSGFQIPPQWLKVFISYLNTDRDYQGSILYSYTWKSKLYFQLEVPTDKCIFCQVINYNGEFIKWPDNLFQQFMDERTNENLVWKHRKVEV
jgi:hypothetical protein